MSGADEYTYRRSKFGAGVFVKGRREYIPVGYVPASLLAKTLQVPWKARMSILQEQKSTEHPAPPHVLLKLEVRKV